MSCERKNRGHFTLRLGPMFSRKTEDMIVEAKKEEIEHGKGTVVCVKPTIDDRYTKEGEWCSHDGNTRQSHLVPPDQPLRILDLVTEATRKVKIDDVQFFEPKGITETVTALVEQGIDVTAAGLRYFFDRQEWPTTATLMEKADQVVVSHAKCNQCGRPAPFNTKIGSEKKVEVGGAEKYGAACIFHHIPKAIKKR